MTSQMVTASKVSAGIGASSTAPQKTVPSSRAFACSAAQRDGSTPATSKPCRSASSRNVPTWQPTSSSRPLGAYRWTWLEAVGERRDATLLLLDVAHVLDRAVQVLHLLVVRARVHVHERAAAALDDRPVNPPYSLEVEV